MRNSLPRTPIIFVNGKFTAQSTTGVQRVANSLLQALDALLLERGDGGADWVLLCPPQGKPPSLTHVHVRFVGPRGLPLHAWEQLVLPWAARQGRLLSLAGSAPALGRSSHCLIHDAAVFDTPSAYTTLFSVWYRLLFRWLAWRGAALASVSAFSVARLALHLGLPADQLSLIPNGADHLGTGHALPSLDRLGLAPDQDFFLAIGSANPNKNHLCLLKAYACLPEPKPQLLVVGDSNERVFRDAGATEVTGLRRLGRVDDAALLALYQRALALVMPSSYEGFGLPAVEAMAQRCPVLAARAAALIEVCGDAAIYVDPGDEVGLTSAMLVLAGDPDLRDRLRQAGLERARLFRWRQSAERLMQFAVHGRVSL